MGYESQTGLRTAEVSLVRGVDEISSAASGELSNSQVSVTDAKHLQMVNWRISKDGKRLEKRDGLTSIDLTGLTGSYPIYGYTSYLNASSVFCQIIVTSKAIWRKIGAAAWISIHTWASDLTHPIDIHEINGMQFFITEIENIKILADGTKCRVSILAPTSLPHGTDVVAAVIPPPAGVTQPLTELFAYANTAALDAVWTDEDAGSAASVIATSGPTSQGPDAHNLYLRLYATAPGSGSRAVRSIAVPTIKPKFNIIFNAYFDALGDVPYYGHFDLTVYTGGTKLRLLFANGYMAWQDGPTNGYSDLNAMVEIAPPKDAWSSWKIVVDASNPSAATFTIYLDGTERITKTFSCPDTTSPSVYLSGENQDATWGVSDTYIDNIKITVDDLVVAPPPEVPATVVEKTGRRQYAITYARSGNYGTESGPIKSIIGAVTFSVAPGLNDMTVGGEYFGTITRTFRVQIDGAASPDTFKWSEDDGLTWASLTNRMTTKVYLPYGIELNFAAVTGHTATNYWSFTCSVCSVVVTGEKVTLASIPTSSDPQVNQRKIYRTTFNGSTFWLLATLNDNTSTTFDDNIPDGSLGVALNDWAEPAPVGKYSRYWDDRLWILADNMAYYSDIEDPEVFQISENFIPVKDGNQGDSGMGLKPYKEDLYIFKRRSTYRVSPRLDGTYSRYCISRDLGMATPAILEAVGLLMFVSFRGVEAFNGEFQAAPIFSLDIDDTFQTIDPAYFQLVTCVHSRKTSEVWFSFPDRSGGNSAVTAVYNYVENAFYFYQFHKTPSKVVEARNSTGGLDVILASRDGLLFTANSGTQDNATNIDASVRTRWFRMPIYENFRHAEIEFEAPTGQTLTAKAYLNFEATELRTISLAGATPTSTDQTLRKPVLWKDTHFLRGEYFSLKFTNATAVGSAMKIASVKLFFAAMPRKDKIQGN